MGCAASTTAHVGPQPSGAHAQRPHHVQAMHPPAHAPPVAQAHFVQPPSSATARPEASALRSARLVRSLVALSRESCRLERGEASAWLHFAGSARAPGEAVAFFLAAAGTVGELGKDLPAQQVTRERFGPGTLQLRLFLAASLAKSLDGFRIAAQGDGKDRHELVLDLRADSQDSDAVTVQRTFFKFTDDTVHIERQLVKVGGVVRSLDALYGTLPNPWKLSSVEAECQAEGDLDAGDCVICLSKPREVAILHCRHVCLCQSCAKITSSTWSFQCPVCRGRVAAMVGLDSSGLACRVTS